MTAALIVLVVLLGSVLILALVAMLQMVKQMKEMVKGLEKQVAGLHKKAENQEVQLAALRVQMEKRGSDPLFEALEALGNFRAKGIWPTVFAVGAKVFRSYWKNGKGKSLPSPSSKEVQP